MAISLETMEGVMDNFIEKSWKLQVMQLEKNHEIKKQDAAGQVGKDALRRATLQ